MEWLRTILENYSLQKEFDIDAVMNAIKKEFPKHAIPKSQYNKRVSRLLADAEYLADLLQEEHEKIQQLKILLEE